MRPTKGKATATPVPYHNTPEPPFPDIKLTPAECENFILRARLQMLEVKLDADGIAFARTMREIHLHKLVMEAPLPWISSLAPSIWRSKGEERPTWIMLSNSSTYLASFPHNLDKATDLWPKLDKIVSDHGYDNSNDVETREAVGKTLDRLWKERDKLNEEDQNTRAQMNEIGSQLPEYSGLFG